MFIARVLVFALSATKTKTAKAINKDQTNTLDQLSISWNAQPLKCTYAPETESSSERPVEPEGLVFVALIADMDRGQRPQLVKRRPDFYCLGSRLHRPFFTRLDSIHYFAVRGQSEPVINNFEKGVPDTNQALICIAYLLLF